MNPAFLYADAVEEITDTVQNSENYEDLKNTTKGFLQLITSSKLYYGIFLLVVMLVCVKIVGLVFKPFKKKSSILVGFIEGCVKVFIIITIGMKVISLSSALDNFTSQILMSSSLIVVVLGFVFQEGLSNIVHGFILSVFKPFHIGDRVSCTIDGENFTGYIKAVDLRSTKIQNVLNNTIVIVPNSKMDLCVIQNTHQDAGSGSISFLDFTITYESNLDKAVEITREIIVSHPSVCEARKVHNISDPVTVMVRDLDINGIALRAIVLTDTIEENFGACSDIRMSLIKRFETEKDIAFAHTQIEIVHK